MGNTNDSMYYHNNDVHLRVNKKIKDDDMSSLVSFIEKNFGSDEILFYNYNYFEDLLTIIYRCNSSKRRMLKRKSICHKDYEFQITNDSKEDLFDVSTNCLILKNIDFDSDKIDSYVNYLIPKNTINNSRVCNVYPNSMLFEFEKHMDFNGLLRNHRLEPCFNGKFVNIYHKMETFMALLKLNVKDKNKQDLLEYLETHFEVEYDICWHSFDDFSIVPFVIVKFVCLDMKNRFFAATDKILSSGYISDLEDVLNIHLLKDFIKSIIDPSVETEIKETEETDRI